MKRLLSILAFAICLISASPSQAQVFVVNTCGTIPSSQATLVPGSAGMLFVDTTGTLCAQAGSGGSSYTVNFGSAIGTKGSPAGFKDSSGNFQPLIGNTAALGQYVDTASGSNLAALLKAGVPCTGYTTSTTQTPVSSGTVTPAGCDLNGNLYVNAALSLVTIPHAQTTALANNLSAKASAGVMTAFNCTSITGGAAGFCIAYNGSTTPSTGALTGANVLDFCYFDTTARGCSLSHIFPGAIAFSSGIQILVSSAASPYTYTTGTDTAAISADYQ